MDIQEFQQKLFAEGKQFGYEEMELYYERAERFGCKLFRGEMDSYDSSEVSGVSFRGLYQGQMGYAFTEKIAEDSIAYLLESAKDNALVVEDEEMNEIFEGSPAYEEYRFDSEELRQVSAHDKIEWLKDLERKVLAYDERITGTNSCMIGSSDSGRVMVNSKGLSLADEHNSLYVYVSVVAKAGSEVKTGSCYKVTQDFSSLDADEIAQDACEEALSQLGAKSIPSRSYPIVLRHDVAAALLSTYASIFSAEQAQKGKSRLKDKVGERIAVQGFNLVDDPFRPDGLASRNFDGEGSASKKLQVIQNGRLESLLHNRKTAKKAGVESTGHAHKSSYKGAIGVAPTNFFVEPTETSFDNLVGGIGEGVLITDLSGLHSGANTISGDFSLAAQGFYIKDGKIESAVNQMTIAGNFFDVLNSIEVIGADLEFSPSGGGYIGSPSLLVRQLSVTVD